jgi:hypothetical protein
MQQRSNNATPGLGTLPWESVAFLANVFSQLAMGRKVEDGALRVALIIDEAPEVDLDGSESL